MKVFDRYLLTEFLKNLCIFLGFFLMLFIIIDFLEQNTRYFPKYGASPENILRFYVYQLPKIVVDLLPFNCMFSTIFTCWMFARNGEIIAIRAAGQSIVRISAPLLVAGICISVLSFVVSDFVVPQGMLNLRRTMSVYIEKNRLEEMFLDGEWIKGTEGLLHFSAFDRVTGQIQDPRYYKLDKSLGLELVVYADWASYDSAKGFWIMEESRVYDFSKSSEGELPVKRVRVFVTTASAKPPRLINQQIPSDQLSFSDLRRLIDQSNRAGSSLSQREVDLYQKISLPFLNFLFILVALPFVRRSERQKETYVGIVSCLVVAILFWVGNASLRSIAQNGFLNPFVAAWIMPLAVTAFGIFNVKKLDKGY